MPRRESASRSPGRPIMSGSATWRPPLTPIGFADATAPGAPRVVPRIVRRADHALGHGRWARHGLCDAGVWSEGVAGLSSSGNDHTWERASEMTSIISATHRAQTIPTPAPDEPKFGRIAQVAQGSRMMAGASGCVPGRNTCWVHWRLLAASAWRCDQRLSYCMRGSAQARHGALQKFWKSRRTTRNFFSPSLANFFLISYQLLFQ